MAEMFKSGKQGVALGTVSSESEFNKRIAAVCRLLKDYSTLDASALLPYILFILGVQNPFIHKLTANINQLGFDEETLSRLKRYIPFYFDGGIFSRIELDPQYQAKVASIISFLNKMQADEPSDRPSATEALSFFEKLKTKTTTVPGLAVSDTVSLLDSLEATAEKRIKTIERYALILKIKEMKLDRKLDSIAYILNMTDQELGEFLQSNEQQAIEAELKNDRNKSDFKKPVLKKAACILDLLDLEDSLTQKSDVDIELLSPKTFELIVTGAYSIEQHQQDPLGIIQHLPKKDQAKLSENNVDSKLRNIINPAYFKKSVNDSPSFQKRLIKKIEARQALYSRLIESNGKEYYQRSFMGCTGWGRPVGEKLKASNAILDAVKDNHSREDFEKLAEGNGAIASSLKNGELGTLFQLLLRSTVWPEQPQQTAGATKARLV